MLPFITSLLDDYRRSHHLKYQLILAENRKQLALIQHMNRTMSYESVQFRQPRNDLDPKYPLVGTSIIFTIVFQNYPSNLK